MRTQHEKQKTSLLAFARTKNKQRYHQQASL